MSILSQAKEPHIHDLALSYMEDKYGETFHFESLWGNSMTGTKQILVSCASFPDEMILVQIENYSNKDRIFSDNYLAVKYKEETLKFFESCGAKVFKDTNIFYEISKYAQSADLPPDASFEVMLADKSAEMIVLIEVSASNYSTEQQIEEITSLISDYCNNVSLTVLVVEDTVYGTLDRKQLGKLISHRDFISCAVIDIECGEVDTYWPGRE